VSEPRLYGELADWFHLLTAPAEYADEADLYRQVLREACDEPPRTVLELGSGGGNNASHLKEGLRVDARRPLARDAAAQPLAVSYITTEEDLVATVATAAAHLRPGGAALFVPDFVRERFEPRTDHGGHDGEHRALRYIEWCWDPDADDTTYASDFAYLLRERDDVRCVLDRHVCGLFPRATWLELLERAGLEGRHLVAPPEEEPAGAELFVGQKPVTA
jgi:hypothetical protein